MGATLNEIVLECLRLMLRPAVHFAVKRSLGIQILLEAMKTVLIDVAREGMERQGETPNVSRLSAATGIHRRDVDRIFKSGPRKETTGSVLSRVLGQWESDPAYLDADKNTRPITYEGEKSEFRKLVRKVSQDINPGTVLLELERLGAVKKNGALLELLYKQSVSYSSRHDPREGLNAVAKDVQDLLQAVDQNIFENDPVPNLHARTEYDNIAQDQLPQIKDWLIREGMEFHKKARNFLSQYDKDINSSLQGRGGGRVVIGTFSRTH